MTRDEFAARSCFSKVPFTSRREARQRASSKLIGGKVAPYRCRIDPEHWHLGHVVPKATRKRNAA